MKKIIKPLQIVLFLLITSICIFYILESPKMTHQTIVELKISSAKGQRNTVMVIDAQEPFWGLDSSEPIEKPNFKHQMNQNEFELILTNKYHRTKTYQIYDLKPEGLILYDAKLDQYIKMPYSHDLAHSELLLSFYPHLLPTQDVVTINDQSTNLPLQSEKWSIKTYDGVWTDYREALTTTTPSNENVTLETLLLTSKSDVFNYLPTKKPDLSVLTIKDSTTEQVVYSAPLISLELPIPEYDGLFQYEIQNIYNQPKLAYRGETYLHFTVKIDLPTEVVLEKSEIEQGDFTRLRILHAEPDETFTVDQPPIPTTLYFSNHTWTGIISSDYRTAPKDYPLIVTSNLTFETTELNLIVNTRAFHIQQLYIDETIAKSTKNDAANAEFAKVFRPVRLQSSPVSYIQEAFLLPTKGRLSTEYGETRHVNGSPTSYRHSGLDIAAPKGQEVYASNTGKIVLAYPLTLTGNTIVIDHGQGLFSVYFHLDQMTVKPDDFVIRGDLIGNVGTTGFSTGPHLHFIISYHSNNLEPGSFIFEKAVTYDNYKTLLK